MGYRAVHTSFFYLGTIGLIITAQQGCIIQYRFDSSKRKSFKTSLWGSMGGVAPFLNHPGSEVNLASESKPETTVDIAVFSKQIFCTKSSSFRTLPLREALQSQYKAIRGEGSWFFCVGNKCNTRNMAQGNIRFTSMDSGHHL